MKHALTFFLIAAAFATAGEKKIVTIQTPSGEVTFKEGTAPKQTGFKDIVTELKPDELAALKEDAERASAFIEAFVLPKDRTDDILENLDAAFAVWLRSGKRDSFADKDVIRIVGSSLGSYAVKQLGVRWARVTDDHGSDIGLVAEHPQTRSFPFTSIQYRIEDNKTDFIVALFRALEHMMKSVSK